MIARREFCAALSVYALIEAVTGSGALAARPSRSAKQWLDGQRRIALALKQGRLEPREWQAAIAALAAGVDLRELLDQTDFTRLRASFDFADGQPSKRFVRFAGQPETHYAYALAYFGFRRGQVITPHGHRNMVSAHMPVAGRFRVRTFDRLGDAPGGLRIRPSGDHLLGPGRVSSMSSQKDNIHWFVAEDDDSATLDVIIDGLMPGSPAYTIDLVDPLGGRREHDGTLFAPFISWPESVAKYAAA